MQLADDHAVLTHLPLSDDDQLLEAIRKCLTGYDALPGAYAISATGAPTTRPHAKNASR